MKKVRSTQGTVRSKQKRHHVLCALPHVYYALKRIRLTIIYKSTHLYEI
jgi:hypothetical protein